MRLAHPRPLAQALMPAVVRSQAAFVIGFILLLPFTATPVGNQLAADYPVALGWLGWVSRSVLDGGDGAYLAGVVFGAALYAIFRRIGRTPNTVVVSPLG